MAASKRSAAGVEAIKQFLKTKVDTRFNFTDIPKLRRSFSITNFQVCR